MTRCIALSAVALLVAGVACADTVFTADFDACEEGAPLSRYGWREVHPDASAPRSSYVVRDGRLVVTSLQAVNLRGGYAEIDMPLCRRGSVEFDLKIDHDARGIGLFMELYNITLFWHDYTGDWRRYFPEPTANRLPLFKVEPVGHRRIGPVQKRVWAHYKINFDTDRDRVEYFKDDMDDPVFIDGPVAVLGRQEYLGGKLRIGSWGATPAPMTFLIDNLRVTSLDATNSAAAATVPRDAILVFNGLSHTRYDLGAALEKAGVAKTNIVHYFMENPSPALSPRNKFYATKLPGLASMAKAECFVLADFPFGPDSVIPDFIVKDLVENVRQGARLVILGGLVSLDKGEYQNSALAPALPVRLTHPWGLKKAEPPLPIAATHPGYAGKDLWSTVPCVRYYHDLELDKGAEVLLTAGDKPLLVRSTLDKGQILVFLGTTCGTVPEDYPQPLFWQWAGWPELVRRIIAGEPTSIPDAVAIKP